jgi:ABC-type nickel/cobalt efflux system permease component RcnA
MRGASPCVPAAYALVAWASFLTLLVLICLLPQGALAEAATPFGVARPDAAPSAGSALGGLGAWILAEQSAFYRHLSTALRASKQGGRATWGLIGLSLAYGVFHAAGPGHGKAVISAYLFASGDTLRRGVSLAFASALVQAVTAVALVAALALLLGATARQMDGVTLTLERVSYGLIAMVGAWLLWRKGRALWRLLAMRKSGEAIPHVHGPECAHRHAPLPNEAAQPGLRGAVGAVLAVGMRPCTGALIVLVFALAQGVFTLGIAAAFAMALGTALTVAAIATTAVAAKGLAVRLAAPGSFAATLALSVLEVAACLMVLALGVTLMIGAVALPGQA